MKADVVKTEGVVGTSLLGKPGKRWKSQLKTTRKLNETLELQEIVINRGKLKYKLREGDSPNLQNCYCRLKLGDTKTEEVACDHGLEKGTAPF